jgi:hypothetical protein
MRSLPLSCDCANGRTGSRVLAVSRTHGRDLKIAGAGFQPAGFETPVIPGYYAVLGNKRLGVHGNSLQPRPRSKAGAFCLVVAPFHKLWSLLNF